MISNETLEAIKRRRSTRDFKREQIKPEELEAVLQAGLYAPFAGVPSCQFTAIQNANLLNRLENAASEAARASGVEHLVALGENEGFHCLYGAPTLIIISDIEHSIAPGINCAAAAENLLIAAESVGLGACWIYFALQAFSSPHGQALREELRLPAGHAPHASVALGYVASSPDPIDRNPNRITYIK